MATSYIVVSDLCQKTEEGLIPVQPRVGPFPTRLEAHAFVEALGGTWGSYEVWPVTSPDDALMEL